MIRKHFFILALFLVLIGLAHANDANPPDFAGSSDSGVVFWEFDTDSDQPTSYDYISGTKNGNTDFGFRYYNNCWNWQTGGYMQMTNCEESLVQPIPAGTGNNITIYFQVTWSGDNSTPPLNLAPELWADYTTTYLGGQEFLAPIDDYTVGGWRQTTWQWTFTNYNTAATHCHIIFNLDGLLVVTLDEVVVDMIIYDGATPPTGPGRNPPSNPKATQPNPANGAFNIDVDTDLSWAPGVNAVDHHVYFGSSNPPPYVTTVSEPNYDPGTMDYGTIYFWHIDEEDVNSNITPGDLWNFSTVNLAGLDAYWRMDDGSGSTVTDDIGGHDGTNYGATWTAGFDNGALYFDGSTDYVGISNPATLNSENDFTWIAWINTTSTGGTILARAGSVPSTWAQGGKVFFLRNGSPHFDVGWVGAVSASKAVNDGQWHQVAVKVEFTGGSDIITFYVDGAPAGGGNLNVDAYSEAGLPLKIGYCNDDFPENTAFAGIIDDVRWYNYALSDSEVGVLYSQAYGGKAFNPVPEDGATMVSIDTDLSWSPGFGADAYNVYFGTNSTPGPGELVSEGQTDTIYDLPMLNPNEDYYWRVDSNVGGGPVTGDIWRFTTSPPPPDPNILGFEEILFIQRPSFASDHFYTEFINYNPGDNFFRSDNGIYRYNLVTKTVTPVITAAEMPGSGEGIFYKFDLGWDASRIVFDYKNAIGEGYRIWICDIDGSNLTQITTTPPDEPANQDEYDMGMYTYNFHYDDMHPCFTQEDTIIFTSTRCKYTTLCDVTGVLTTPVLHRINLDGTGLEKLTDSPVSEFAPSMMVDGRVVYTRWEYVDKDSLYCKVGYAMNPDGTHVNEIFGLDQHSPPTLNYFRQCPDNPNKFVCVGAPHYNQGDNLGPILLIDRTKEVRTHEDPDDPTTGPAVTYVTPDVHIWQEPGWNFWTGSGWVEDGSGTTGRLYTTPYPVNENEFLVTCKPAGAAWNQRDAFDIYLIDTSGGHILIVSQPGTSCWNPYPLKKRPKPIKINALKFPAFLLPNGDPNQGLALVTDVYKGMNGVARGDVKYLRVNIAVSRPWSCQRINLWGPRGEGGPYVSSTNWISALWPRVQLGIVPVEEDGSAYFVVPADRNIFLQAMDSEYRELQRERTYVNFRPGEFRSCIGCHERSGEAPTPPFGSSEAPMALQNDPCIPAPMPGEAAGTGNWAGWGVKILYYPYDIQPILDSKCITCHYDGGQDPDLTGGITTKYNTSYENLSGYCGPMIDENNDHMWRDYTEYKPPKYFGCYSSILADKLYNDPDHRERLTNEELWKIFRWIDTNYSFYGTYYGRHHSDYSSDPDFRRMPTVEEALSNEAPSWHN